MKHKFLVIEGNIGAGKTTLARFIAETYNYDLILEEFAENTFLPQFYESPERFAFPLEMSFMAARYNQLKDFFSRQSLPFPVVADYMFDKSLVFAKVNLRKEEFQLFDQFFKLLNSHLRKPDLIVYLHKEVGHLQKNIQRRGRDFEQQIKDDYLDKINSAYYQFLKKSKSKNILLIETEKMDFVSNKNHLQTIFEKIEKKI